MKSESRDFRLNAPGSAFAAQMGNMFKGNRHTLHIQKGPFKASLGQIYEKVKIRRGALRDIKGFEYLLDHTQVEH